MKKSVWVGVPFSIIFAIATAQAAGSVSGCAQSSQATTLPRNVVVLEDGSIRILDSNGGSVLIPKKTVDLIKQLNLSTMPNFDRGTPCYAIGVQSEIKR